MQEFALELASFLKAFTLIFAIMDPFASIPVFMTLTKKFKSEDKVRAANQALMVAAAVIVVFLFFGTNILQLFGITLRDFKIAGGAVLGILGIQIVLGLGTEEKKTKDYHVAATIIGVPLITGPGVITSTIVLSASEGWLITLIAAAAALFLNWLMLRYSGKLHGLIGENFIEIFSKIMGLLLIAVAVGFIRSGLGG